MAELLLELLSEEIPARMQARAAEDLKRLVTTKLKEAGLSFDNAEAYVTPRRLALVVEGLPKQLPDVTEEKKGPRVGAPEKAVQGFKASLPERARVETRETEKGTFYFAVIEKKGFTLALLIGNLITDVVRKFPWPKSMRWGETHGQWVRPIRNILCLIGPTESIVITLEPGEGFRTTETVGHRFLSPDWFEVKCFADYKAKLAKNKVMLDLAERRGVIRQKASELARVEGLKVERDDALLAEVAGLVEWPVALIGSIDEEFMALPPEVLTTVMRQNQKYFSLLKKDGSLAPRFIVVADTAPDDGGKAIVAGNERVLRARLADARFFWDRDRKAPLKDRVPALEEIIFHEMLGKMSGKVERMQTLAAEIGARIPGCDPEKARRAALLCKADLTTELVVEFPALQGVMGRYYALNDGEKPEVADAIAQHYAPQGPDDRCPTAPVSVAVALADKIDTLVGFFAVGEKPTGSKDPFAVRRAALGVIRLIVENGLRLSLRSVFETHYGPIDSAIRRVEIRRVADRRPEEGDIQISAPPEQPEEFERRKTNVSSDLLDFFADRLKVHLREKGVRHDLISAVFALGGEDDLVRLLGRVDALEAFLRSDDGANLLIAYRRAANIVWIEEKKDGKPYDGAPLSDWFQQDEEKNLHTSLTASLQASSEWLQQEDFGRAMSEFARLRQPVDAFFDHVTVNCDDANLRENRLRLLSQIRATLDQVADFSRIEGESRR